MLVYSLPLANVQAQNLQTGVTVDSKLIALTSDVVTADNSKPTIEVTDSEYQKQQATAAKQAATPRVLVAAVNTVEPSLDVKRALVQKVAGTFGIDWKILEAVWQIESGKSWKTSTTSHSGALGPCQFMPGTWRSYAIDGNGDGVKDVTSAQDCLYGSAKLLASNGAASGNVTGALLHYNHSMAYVYQVLKIAKSI